MNGAFSMANDRNDDLFIDDLTSGLRTWCRIMATMMTDVMARKYVDW